MAPHGFPGVERIADLHEPAPNCGEGAPLPEVEARPLVTWRVVIAMTDACLRLPGFEMAPKFGQPAAWLDDLAEFTTEDAAQVAIWHIQHRADFDRTVILVVRATTHPGLDYRAESKLYSRVCETARVADLAYWRLTEPRHRSLCGLAPLAMKAGW